MFPTPERVLEDTAIFIQGYIPVRETESIYKMRSCITLSF